MITHGMGWSPDLPDFRDYHPLHSKVEPVMSRVNILSALPPLVDLREWCPPIEDQGQIGSCTAQAGVALFEYFQNRVYGTHTDMSRLFVYKTTRNLLRWTGDTGAFLRTTMGAMRLFGAPPESFWPYDTSRFDEEPPPWLYSMAKEYQAVNYVRLDTVKGQELIDRLKSYAWAGFATMFGFTVYNSIYRVGGDGMIPIPTAQDYVVGGHAVVIVGYSDNRQAFLIRNSWGRGWGADGYGWMPYEYILKGLASDFWTLISAEWVDTQKFGVV